MDAMWEMDLVSMLMFGLGLLIGIYAFVYGMLVWRGYFSERKPADTPEAEPPTTD